MTRIEILWAVAFLGRCIGRRTLQAVLLRFQSPHFLPMETRIHCRQQPLVHLGILTVRTTFLLS